METQTPARREWPIVPTGERRTMSIEEAARRLGIGRSTLYEAANRGELPVLRIGRRRVVRCATVERLLADKPPADSTA